VKSQKRAPEVHQTKSLFQRRIGPQVNKVATRCASQSFQKHTLSSNKQNNFKLSRGRKIRSNTSRDTATPGIATAPRFKTISRGKKSMHQLILMHNWINKA